MVYKSLNGLASDYLAEMFADRSNITNYTLRDTSGQTSNIPQPQTDYLKIVLVTAVRYCGTRFLVNYDKLALYMALMENRYMYSYYFVICYFVICKYCLILL